MGSHCRLRDANSHRKERNEILEQSQAVYRQVLDDPSFGERLVGGERPIHWDHVFASIQSLHRTIDALIPPKPKELLIM